MNYRRWDKLFNN